LNLYGYVYNNPLNGIDILGLDLNLLVPNIPGSQGRDQRAAAARISMNNIGGNSDFEVHGHGACGKMWDDRKAEVPAGVNTIWHPGVKNRIELGAKQLADLIQANGWKPGMDITLLVCDSGVEVPGTESLADALAQELASRGKMPQNVRAPNGLCGIAQESPYSAYVPTTKDKRLPGFYTVRKLPK
jgi:hypothetical protein